MALWEELADREGKATSLLDLAWIAYHQADFDRAETLAGEALEIFAAQDHELGRTGALTALGLTALSRGNFRRAEALHRESMARRMELGTGVDAAVSRGYLGLTSLELGDIERAEALIRESLRQLNEWGDEWGIAAGLEGLASVGAAKAQARRAARLFGAAAAIHAQLGVPTGPIAHVTRDRYQAEVREALGDELFASAWTEGHALSRGEAIGARSRIDRAATD